MHVTGIKQRYDLTRHLVRRDFMLRYHASSLGVLWSILLPLSQLAVFVFLFRRIVPLGIEAYPAFVFSALLPWAWLSNSLAAAGTLFLGNRDLVRRPGFPLPVLVIVSTLSNLLTYLVSLPVLALVLVLYHRPLTAALVALPVLLVLQGMLTVGLGLIIATLNVFFRDVQHIVTVLLSLLFYLTPVFYRLPDTEHAWLFGLNPVATLIEAYRDIFFYGVAPWGDLLAAAVVSVLAFGLGWVVYARWHHDVIDAI